MHPLYAYLVLGYVFDKFDYPGSVESVSRPVSDEVEGSEK